MTKDEAAAGPQRERWFWLAVIAILVLAVVFRLPGIATRSLWIDELFTEWFAARSLTELWSDVPEYETHPPFYYSLLRLWTLVFGNTELGLRSLSLVLSLATVGLVAASGLILRAGATCRAAGLFGALLLAVNYANIRDAQNARPYALQTFLCTVAIVAALVLVSRLLRSTENRAARADWKIPALVLGVSAGLGLWVHNTGFFIAFGIWLGLALTLFLTPRSDRLGHLLIFVGAGILALLVWSPYLPIFLEQSRKFMGLAFWLTPKTRDLYSAWMLLLGPHWLVLLLAIVLLAIGLYRLARRAPALAIVAAVVLMVPLHAVLAVSFSIKPIYIQRLFAWMVPLSLALLALGVVTLARSIWPRILVGLVVLAISVVQTVWDYARPIDDWKMIVEEIAANAQPGDVVVTVPAEGSIATGYYIARQEDFPPVICVPGCYPQRDLPRTYLSNLGAPEVVEADGALVEQALRKYRRVWLVQVSIALYDPKGIVRSRIAAARTFVRYKGNSLAKVELFE